MTYEPAIPIHPCETLIEVLEDRGYSFREFCHLAGERSEIGIHLFAVLNGKASIDEPLALFLSDTLDIPSVFWLRLQDSYDKNPRTKAVEP